MEDKNIVAQDGVFDPETCPLEVLRQKIDQFENEEDFYNTMQLSAKTFINSVYGVFGTEFFNLANTDIAESITLQGQDLIKYSVVQINDYIKNLWNQDYDGHKRIADRMKGIFGDAFAYDKFLEAARNNKIMVDTMQIYGDSVTGDSMIDLHDGSRMSIEEMFNECCDSEAHDKIRVKSSRIVKSYDLSHGDVAFYGVKYIMRHYTDKSIWEIVSKCGKSICVTGDHSVMVSRNDNIIEMKPYEILDTDRLVISEDDKSFTTQIVSVKCVNERYAGFVYDIAIDTDTENHNFFANGILVHNTDSVSGDSVVITEKHPEGIAIEKFYNENVENVSDSTKAGHESIWTDDKVLNYSIDSFHTGEYPLYYGKVKRIIRHKVSKAKWVLRTDFDHEVFCTEDHSIVVYRNDHFAKVRPSDVTYEDKVAIADEMYGDLVEDLVHITSCECVGEYKNEYVYDIEMDDENHTFFANGILVHNSAYITMQPVIDACYIPKDQELEFDLAFYDEILEAYMDGKFDEYAAKFNCKKNLEKFELEKISRTIIMLAKKNYMCDVEWIDSGARFEPTHHITYTGFDVVKGSTPEYCRKEMKDFVTFVMGVLNTGRKPTLGEIVKRLVDIKKRFSMQSPNDIAKSTSISNYESFVMNDKGPEIKYFEFKTALDANGQPIQTGEKLPVPIHVRAAAIYNNMLFNKAKKYRSKYNLLKSGDKVRFYYTGDDSVFGFVPDLFPMEFAPKMNIDIQFEKMLLSPLNRIIVALGYNEIAPTLTYTPSLF